MNIQAMIDEYIDFLKKGITYRQIEKGYEITTPFLNDSNDHMQIYIKEIDEERIVLSDGGDSISYLEDCGVSLTQSRRQMITEICNGYGIAVREGQLTIKSSIKEFPQKKHFLLQAMLKVNDMVYTVQSRTISMFVDNVSGYFDKNEIYATRNISLMGQSGIFHNYDFLLNRDRYFSERFCNAVNAPTKNNIMNTIFMWNDTQKKRNQGSEFLVFINDEGKHNTELIKAFNEYNIDVILKSKMETEETLRKFKKVS